MAAEKIPADEFLKLAEVIPVCDVRSPSEFRNGHIPGAVNIPLFDDREREIVGTRYRKEGRIPAITEGLKLTGPSMADKLKRGLESSSEGRLLVHCWRGGMRSEAMAWLFSLGDLKTWVLEGGYKAYRNFILEKISGKRKMIVLGGLTGSSKTYILKCLKTAGQQIIDLEGLANHKGSAFGALGEPPQPSTEHFANILYDDWKRLDPNLPFWVEDESRNIGTVFIQDSFYANMQESPTIVLMMDAELRIPRLLAEYSAYPVDKLRESVLRISKRLGGDDTREALNALDSGDFARVAGITLRYYDKAYLHSLKRKQNPNLIFVNTDTADVEINALKVLETARQFKW